MTTMLTPVVTECPESDCEWGTFHFYPEPILHTHLIEKHGYDDTTAHVLAAEAVSPVEGEDTTDMICRHCDAPLALYDDDDAGWSTVHTRSEGGSGSYCPANAPTYSHKPTGV